MADEQQKGGWFRRRQKTDETQEDPWDPAPGQPGPTGIPTPEPAGPSRNEPPLEQVTQPGPVKRILFQDDGTPMEAPEPAPATSRVTETVETLRLPAARRDEAIDAIESEVDHLGHPRGTWSTERSVRLREVYRTDHGSHVRSARGPESRVLYVSRREGQHEEDHRFVHAMVDRVIAGVDLRGETTVRETVTELEPRKVRVVEQVPAAKPSYQPQCRALTEDGVQCRNSTRTGSQYCSSHQGYRVPTVGQVIASKDTEPHHEVALDTAPGEEAWDPDSEHQPQCGAFTAEGMQCRNSSKAGSKYCASHAGYRAPSESKLLKGLDTKPRWPQAKDTKPKVKGKKGKR